MASKGIHNYDLGLKSAIDHLKDSGISKHNKDLILKFDKDCQLEGLSKPRRMKLIGSLKIVARDYITVNFDKAVKEDIKKAVLEIESRDDYSVWTKQSYRAIIKKFFKWIKYGSDYNSRKEYPKIVSWINTNIKRKDKPMIQSRHILTEDEIKKLIDVAEHPRDKAFISMLYELGARIGEIGNLLIKDVTKDQYGYLVDLNGKTGGRTNRIVVSSPYLTAWINIHPNKNNLDSPLWIFMGNRDKTTKMQYGSFRALVKRLVKKSGIKKRIHPHLFRHTRATHLLINKQISEAQAKVYFGWTPSSNMLSEYSHLTSKDVNDSILEINGIKKREKTETKSKVKRCPVCTEINSNDARFCGKCGNVIDTKTSIELDEKRKAYDYVVASVMKNPKLRRKFVEDALKLGVEKKFQEML